MHPLIEKLDNRLFAHLVRHTNNDGYIHEDTVKEIVHARDQALIDGIEKAWNKIEKLDHRCKCEDKHFVSIERNEYDKFINILNSFKPKR